MGDARFISASVFSLLAAAVFLSVFRSQLGRVFRAVFFSQPPTDRVRLGTHWFYGQIDPEYSLLIGSDEYQQDADGWRITALSDGARRGEVHAADWRFHERVREVINSEDTRKDSRLAALLVVQSISVLAIANLAEAEKGDWLRLSLPLVALALTVSMGVGIQAAMRAHATWRFKWNAYLELRGLSRTQFPPVVGLVDRRPVIALVNASFWLPVFWALIWISDLARLIFL